MKTAEENLKEITDAIDCVSNLMCSFKNNEALLLVLSKLKGKVIEYANQSKWISVEDGTPEMLEGENYSKNVFAICKELHGLQVFCYCYNPSETDNERGFFWANCYQNIDGECEFDDNYTITHWQPLPEKP